MLPSLVATKVKVASSPTMSSTPGALSASCPFVAFSMLMLGAGVNGMMPASMVRSSSPGAMNTIAVRPVAGSALLSTARSSPAFIWVNVVPSGASNSTAKVPEGTMNSKNPSASVLVSSMRTPSWSSSFTKTLSMPGSPASWMPLLLVSSNTKSPRRDSSSTLIGTKNWPIESSPMLPSAPPPILALMPKSSDSSLPGSWEKLAIENTRSGDAADGLIGAWPISPISAP